MKTKAYRYFTSIALLIILCSSANAENLRKLVSLSGYWKFSIGDDLSWANPAFNDSDWDQISAPSPWENEGYKDYNGYAWYRKSFHLNNVRDNSTIYLLLGRIDDADEVYLNGKLIGKSGKFPPNYESAYSVSRKYIISPEDLNTDGENLIAVRVYDSYLEGGLVDGQLGLFYDEDTELLSLDLSGKWKFHTGNNKDWKSPEFNDQDWKLINVPDAWENEGYEDYDGYAWYRMKFRLPETITDKTLYLSLGKIDDIDDVYLNGEHIGNVYDLKRDYYTGWGSGDWEYAARRVYKIPEGLLVRNGINTIAVKVYDEHGAGGIYEGPIGIMPAENYREYRDRNHSYQNFWEYIFNKFTGN